MHSTCTIEKKNDGLSFAFDLQRDFYFNTKSNKYNFQCLGDSYLTSVVDAFWLVIDDSEFNDSGDDGNGQIIIPGWVKSFFGKRNGSDSGTKLDSSFDIRRVTPSRHLIKINKQIFFFRYRFMSNLQIKKKRDNTKSNG